MKHGWTAIGMAALTAASTHGQGTSETMPTPEEMYHELKALRTEVRAYRAEQSDTFLTEERAEQVRSLVHEVLADVDTRASLLDNGVTAGYDNGAFFLGSADGDFLLKIGGQIQVRYLLNSRDDDTNALDNWEGGFSIRRAKLNFSGHVGSPRLDYVVQLAANRNTGAVELEDAIIGYRLDDNWRIFGGRFQDTFSREQLMSSKRQLTVDRSAVANIFAANDGYVEGIGVEWKIDPDMLNFGATINDGFNSGTPGGTGTGFLNTPNDFQNDSTDFAVSARLDWKLTGEWSQAADVSSWQSSEDLAAFLGGGIHYEVGETGDGQSSATTAITGGYDNFLIWTVDALVKCHRFGVMGSVYGWHFDSTDTNPIGDTDHYGAMLQAGYMIIPDKLEPFVRYEWIDIDDAISSDELQLLTGGFNYYIRGHSAKFTADVVWALDNINAGSTLGTGLSGIGLLGDAPGQEDQFVTRLQFQLLF